MSKCFGIVGSWNLTMDEGEYKYGREQTEEEEPGWDGLQFEVKIRSYIVNRSFVCCTDQEVKKLQWKCAYVGLAHPYYTPHEKLNRNSQRFYQFIV